MKPKDFLEEYVPSDCREEARKDLRKVLNQWVQDNVDENALGIDEKYEEDENED